MKKTLLFLLLICCVNSIYGQTFESEKIDVRHSSEKHSFNFPNLANSWDEAIPLGNGLLGALIWKKDGKLRISIDRSDLWDKRPLGYHTDPRFVHDSIAALAKKGDMKPVSEIIKYNKEPGPAKIPAGAIVFDISNWGKITSVKLNIKTAISTIEWENGIEFECFVHATKPLGWYKFNNLPFDVKPKIIPPDYDGKRTKDNKSWWLLKNLKYPASIVESKENSILYTQKCWADFSFRVQTEWKKTSNTFVGNWTVTTNESKTTVAGKIDEDKQTHNAWWLRYWNKSSISIPDPTIEKQYYRDMYKFGAVARRGAPAISLQAVWTPDNDEIAPWFGDFHNDLNTQLSYWPSYTGNRLDEAMGYLEWNWKNIPEYKKFTNSYFNAKGMNIPGISTIEGKPMGSWVQYSLSSTAAGWVAQHFYLQWRYSMDKEYLKNMGYPWLKDVALFFEDISIEKNGKRSIVLSASPEIYNNSRKAWFDDITNFDLSIIRFTYKATAEMAEALGKKEEAKKWLTQLKSWPQLARGADGELLLAPEHPLKNSHRHHSHLLAIHPLGLIDVNNGELDKKTVLASLNRLDSLGTKNWVGYSFPWQACLKARAYDGNGAAEALRIFSNAFCLKNSFHVNGDQTKSGYSNYTYRPFTLEGNFAFASAVHEMLIQSHAGFINIFPAIPTNWQDVSFQNLRTEGAFLVSAKRENGRMKQIVITSEKGGLLKIKNPFQKEIININNKNASFGDYIKIDTNPGEVIKLNGID